MANEKILNSRLLLKYDTLAAWQSSDFNKDDASKYLKAGEAAVVLVNTWKLDADGNQIAVPTCLMKIGDGKTKFDSLNWIAAQAADVYDWAKKASLDLNDLPDIPVKDEGTGKFVIDVAWNEESNEIVISRDDVAWSDIDGELPTDKLPEIPWTKIPEIPTNKLPEIPADKLPNIAITDDTEAEVPNTATVNVYKNLTANGHALTEELVQVATAAGVAKAVEDLKDELEQEITAGMTFKGATSSLPTSPETGDMWKVSGSFAVNGETAKIGDTIVYGTNSWFLIPSGDDIEDTWRPVTDVDNDSSLTFKAGPILSVEVKKDGDITYSHSTVATPTGQQGTGRSYLTGVTTDNYGHITGYTYASEVDQDLSIYKTKQDQVNSPNANGSTLAFIDTISQNENGVISVTKKNVNLSDYALKSELPVVPVVNDGTFTVSGINSLTGSGSMSANQSTNTVANLDVANKGITTAKIADHAVGAHQTKACVDYKNADGTIPADAEVWVFYSGTSTILV